MKNKCCSRIFTKSRITIKISWITCKIFLWSKLHRIDKDANDYFIIFCYSTIDQAFMSFM